ncbi:hypothetical protein FRC12_016053 [Ceratobasidium sp. 428]|nr:hypothetical protein FRC12_016053 [Ceratobasidium sp. 428]
MFEAFNFKVNTDFMNCSYNKLQQAFPSCMGDLPSIKKMSTRVAKKSDIQGTMIHCCVNSCVTYTNYYRDLEAFPVCNQPCYQPSTRNPNKQVPHCVFHYLPLSPRLQNWYFDPAMAEALSYRDQYQPDGNIWDIFDGAHYQKLRGERVTVNTKTLDHNYFSEPTDITLGIATNGFGPFKSRKQSCWPIIAFNYNLPPALRFKLKYTLCLGVIPGPNSPVELETFLKPLIAELEDLTHSIPAFHGGKREPFCFRAYLLASFGNMPAITKLMCMKGHNRISGCRACKIIGVCPGEGPGGNTSYAALSHPFAAHREYRNSYNPRDLPLQTHNKFVWQAMDIEECVWDEARSGINGLSSLLRVPGIDFPGLFPLDFMHAMFENVIKTLINLWTHG